MISRIRIISLLGVIVLLSSRISPQAQSSELLRSVCMNNTYNPNVNRTYSTNLNFLLSILSEASRTKDFYKSTAGLNTSEPSYGLYMCRADVTGDLCHSCMQNASREVLKICTNQTFAIIWYDNCMLRYSKRSIISSPDLGVLWPMYIRNVTVRQLDGFYQLLEEMLNRIASDAANDLSSKKFAVQEGQISPSEKLYAMGQCTPDLSNEGCYTCLQDAVSIMTRCCDTGQVGRVLKPSCNMRYDSYKFYNITDDLSPLPSPNSTFPAITSRKGKSISVAVIIAIVVSIIVSAVLFVLAFLPLKRKSNETYGVVADGADANDVPLVESIQYSFSEIQAATNNFSIDHKIGEGGFGLVYKGTLPNGQDIAVKRLSKTSSQGVEEFKNEISLVAKLQHRNLVRLLGFSLQGEEKLLIYEFVPNKSLDYFLFNGEKQGILDWSRRQKIIAGIARGLLYLHEDSRLRIIHRDLKASNILLDENMNPKIADFGTARIFGVDQSKEKTNRIAGTYGYMPPEYVIHGQFSVKSDVYSFGVIVLEIISGKKNSNFYRLDLGEESLLSYAWKNWRNGTPLALLDSVDQQLSDTNYSRNEILHYMHVGLLCVQEDVEQRPTMASVVLMLSSRSITLAVPHHPAFFVYSKTEPSWPRIDLEESDKSTTKAVPASVNQTSITELYPR